MLLVVTEPASTVLSNYSLRKTNMFKVLAFLFVRRKSHAALSDLLSVTNMIGKI